MTLSPHFTYEELTRTNTIGEPDAAAIECLRTLCVNILEPVRKHFGVPVTINSGYRSVEHEHAQGRSGISQHCRGQAADIEIPGISNAELWLHIVRILPFDQIIAEKLMADDPKAGWIHVSYIPSGRHEKLSFLGDRYVHGFQYIDR